MTDSVYIRSLREVRIGEVTRQVRVAKNANTNLTETFLGLEHIESATGQIVGSSSASSVKSRGNLFESGDVLYGRMRPHLRKVAIAEFPGFASGEILVFKCSDEITPEFLRTVLLSEHFTQYALARTRGDRPRISREDVSAYQFELPTLDIQERISSRDGLAVLLRAASQAQGDNAIRAATRALDEIREQKIWGSPSLPRDSLSNIFESINYGTSTKSGYQADGVPVLRIPNIGTSGAIDSSDLKYAPLSLADAQKYAVRQGDLLFIRSNGSSSLVGRAAIVDRSHEGFAFAGYLLRARPKEIASAEFLWHLTQTRSFRALVSAATQSTAGINNLSGGRLSKFVVPFPGISIQEKIAEDLSHLESKLAASATYMDIAHAAAARAHSAARQSWLRQRPAQVSTRDQVQEKNTVKVERRAVALSDMGTSTPREMVLRQLEESGQPVGFRDLFHADGEAYDRMRDAVFEMLAEEVPVITQYYDANLGRLLLRRTR